MKILLTGAQGFLGRHLLPELLKRCDVRCLVRKDFVYQHPRLEICVGDVTDESMVKRCMRGVDAVVHAAALLHSTAQETFAVNVEGTRHLVRAAKKHRVKHFIFISTENVLYDYCQDPYTRSKREAEHLVETLRASTILRPSIIYGKDDDKYLSYLISFVKRSPLVPVLGDGENLLQPVYVDDVVTCVLHALTLPVRGTYTVCGPQPYSYNDLIRFIADFYGVKRLILHFPLWLLKPLVTLYEHLVRMPKITSSSLAYFRYDRAHDVNALRRTFRYTPLDFPDALRHLAR